jgi:hypothetical protein
MAGFEVIIYGRFWVITEGLQEHGYALTSVLHPTAFLYFLTQTAGTKALLPDPYDCRLAFTSWRRGDLRFTRARHRQLLWAASLIGVDGLPEQRMELKFSDHIEFWNQDASRCEKVIEPFFDRTVSFEIDDSNFHAVRPVAFGSGAARKAFAAYFHTVDGKIGPPQFDFFSFNLSQ